MLFLLRPRQSMIPIAMPVRPQQNAHVQMVEQAYGATRRVEPAAPRDTVTQLKDLADLHSSGKLSDEEFASAKAKVLGSDTGTT
jgi:hypothetical protein